MPPAKGPTVDFVFPPGHPRHGKTVVLGNCAFQEGRCAVPAQDASKYARILTRYHGAAVEGSEEYAEIAAQYAPKPDPAAEAAKAEAASKGKK